MVNNYFPESDDWLYFLSTLICSIFVNILAIIQIKNVYLDLCTKSRKSVVHKRKPPELTPLYKTLSHVTWFSLFCYGITEILECIKQGPSGECRLEFYIIMFFWNWSKSALFTVYLLRLESTFGDSAYAYPKRIVYGLIVLQWIFGLILPIFCNIYSEVFVYDEDGFPDPCWGIFANWNIIWIIVWDLSMNIGCLIAFTIPLYRVLHNVTRSGSIDDTKQDIGRNMKHIAIKVTILTAVSAVTTVIGLVLYTLFTFGHIFPYDWAVNSVCLMLMTPYYPDEKYYNRLCGLCIRCFFKKYENIAITKVEDNTQTPDGASRTDIVVDSIVTGTEVTADTNTVSKVISSTQSEEEAY